MHARSARYPENTPVGEADRAERPPSDGAATMNLVTAAHSLGFAASWLTEWYAYDRAVLDALGLSASEKIVGFVHIGRAGQRPEDRPRPPLSEIVSRFDS